MIKNACLAFAVSIFLFVSCDTNDYAESSSEPPIINQVSEAVEDVPVTVGFAGNVYIVRGSGLSSTQKVYFNGLDTYFNPTLVTDTVLIIQVDQDTPYANVSNELLVETVNGSATYEFVIAPPAPVFKSFNPINPEPGEEITIYGNYFLDPVVEVDGVEATIISFSIDEIVAILPADSNNKYITVSTISGSSQWSTAVGTAFMYDDDFIGSWTIPSWNNHEFITNEEEAFQGTTFFTKEIAGYDNIQSDWTWVDDPAIFTEYTGIKFAIKSDVPGKLVLIFNGANWVDANFSFETSSDCQEIEFTWAELSNPTFLQNISFQEFTGNTINYSFDNFVYTLD